MLSERIEGYVVNSGLSDPKSCTQNIDKEEVEIWLRLSIQLEAVVEAAKDFDPFEPKTLTRLRKELEKLESEE